MRSERQALADIAALPGYVNADGSAWLDAGLVSEILEDVQPEPAPDEDSGEDAPDAVRDAFYEGRATAVRRCDWEQCPGLPAGVPMHETEPGPQMHPVCLDAALWRAGHTPVGGTIDRGAALAAIIACAPRNMELRPDGSEDRLDVAYVEGVHAAHAAVSRLTLVRPVEKNINKED